MAKVLIPTIGGFLSLMMLWAFIAASVMMI